MYVFLPLSVMCQMNVTACNLLGKYKFLVKSGQGQLQLLAGIYEIIFFFPLF